MVTWFFTTLEKRIWKLMITWLFTILEKKHLNLKIHLPFSYLLSTFQLLGRLTLKWWQYIFSSPVLDANKVGQYVLVSFFVEPGPGV